MLKMLGACIGFGFLSGVAVCAGTYISIALIEQPSYYADSAAILSIALLFGLVWSVIGVCLFPVLYRTQLNTRPVTLTIAALAAGAAVAQTLAIVAGVAFFAVCRCRAIVDANLGSWDGRAEVAFLFLPGVLGALIMTAVLAKRSRPSLV